MAGCEPFRPTGADVARHLVRLAGALGRGVSEGSNVPLGPLKEQLGYLCRSLVDGVQLQRRLLRMTTLASFLEAADAAFRTLPDDAFDLAAAPRAS
jgi:hypothetical protein